MQPAGGRQWRAREGNASARNSSGWMHMEGQEDGHRRAQASDGQAPRKPSLPPGLHIVATPIGNLRDITLRALDVLRAADLIACEDTRVFAKLASHYDIAAPTIAYSDATQDTAEPRIVHALGDGKRVALVSDAGMPLVSDPGYRL